MRELTEYAFAHITEPDGFGPLCGMVLSEVAERRTTPREDFLSEISSAEMLGGRPITDNDNLGVVNGLIIAGHETTMNASAVLALDLGRDPGLRARIVADPELIPAVVEESLRHDSPVQNFTRTLTRDVVVDGATMHEGERVMLIYVTELLAARDFTVVGEPVYGGPMSNAAFSGLTSLTLAFR